RLPIVAHSPRVRRTEEITISQRVLRRVHPELEVRAAGAGPTIILLLAILQQPSRANIVSWRAGHIETAGRAINSDHRLASVTACHHIGAGPEADTIGPLAGFHGHEMRTPQLSAR